MDFQYIVITAENSKATTISNFSLVEGALLVDLYGEIYHSKVMLCSRQAFTISSGHRLD